MSVKTVYLSKVGRDYKLSEHFKVREFACKDGSDKVLYATELFERLEEMRAYLGGDGVCTIAFNSGYRTAAYNRSIGGASSSTHCMGYAGDIVVKVKGKRVSGKLICCLAQTLGFKGVALIKGSGYSVHVDMYPNRTYRGDERYGYGNNVGGDFYKYFGISKSQITALKAASYKEKETAAPAKANATVKAWQSAARADGFTEVGKADGIFGDKSKAVAKKALCYCRSDKNYKNKNLTKIVQATVGVKVDGKFGADTEKAVIAYQKAHGLKADGVVGYNTWKVILGV